MFTSRRSFAVVVGLLLAIGCSSGEAPDAGTIDAGAADGSFDAGHGDAGTIDAGTIDAGAADGSSDGGHGDAGTARDGGRLDAGAPDAGCHCAPGVCLRDGGCGACRNGGDCPLSRPFCGTSNQCLECASSPNDTCPEGRYCALGNCVTGCRNGAMCPSDICLASHDCFNCRLDSQCADGGLCESGECHPRCGPLLACPKSWSCCSGRCVDPSRDRRNFGATCGNTCAAGSFCGGGACRTTVFNNVCHGGVIRIVNDGEAADDGASASIANALLAACPGAGSTLRVGDQTSGLLDVVTGEPLQTGELLVMSGGSYHQLGIRWLEDHALARVIDDSDQTNLRYIRSDGGLVYSAPQSTFSPTHDTFLVELTTTPKGSLVLNASGYRSQGTIAAAWYLVNELMPKLDGGAFTDSWYVVDWRNSSNAGGPDSADTWTPIASGK